MSGYLILEFGSLFPFLLMPQTATSGLYLEITQMGQQD